MNPYRKKFIRIVLISTPFRPGICPLRIIVIHLYFLRSDFCLGKSKRRQGVTGICAVPVQQKNGSLYKSLQKLPYGCGIQVS